jgi:hypothetical protein
LQRLTLYSLPNLGEFVAASPSTSISLEQENPSSYHGTEIPGLCLVSHSLFGLIPLDTVVAASAALAPKMASDKPEKKKEKSKDKKEKKDKKRSETDGVHKDKKDRKEKNAKKEKLESKVSAALDEQLQAEVAISAAKAGVVATPMEDESKKLGPKPALVPFAIPLADEKAMKKVLKTVRKCEFARFSFRPYIVPWPPSASFDSPFWHPKNHPAFLCNVKAT